VPLFSVLGLIISLKTGADRSLCVLGGAVVGALCTALRAKG
jgi:hypothetical protein